MNKNLYIIICISFLSLATTCITYHGELTIEYPLSKCPETAWEFPKFAEGKDFIAYQDKTDISTCQKYVKFFVRAKDPKIVSGGDVFLARVKHADTCRLSIVLRKICTNHSNLEDCKANDSFRFLVGVENPNEVLSELIFPKKDIKILGSPTLTKSESEEDFQKGCKED